MSCLVLDWGMDGPWAFSMIHVEGKWPRPPRRTSSCHLIPCTLPLLVLDISTIVSLLHIYSICLAVLISHTRHTMGFFWIPAKGKGDGSSVRRCVQTYCRLQVVKSSFSIVWVQDTPKVPKHIQDVHGFVFPGLFWNILCSVRSSWLLYLKLYYTFLELLISLPFFNFSF